MQGKENFNEFFLQGFVCCCCFKYNIKGCSSEFGEKRLYVDIFTKSLKHLKREGKIIKILVNETGP